jgi:competence protein CoiA
MRRKLTSMRKGIFVLVAHDERQNRVLARDIDKGCGPFSCPVCQMPVRLRKGSLRIHHFAHMPYSTCAYGAGESEAHRKAKEGVYLALQDKNVFSVLEAPLGDLRPDIMAMIDNQIVGIEVQISAISLDEIVRRTLSYTKKGMAVIWILCSEIPTENEQTRFQWRQRFLHGLYFGRIYYYAGKDLVTPVHLSTSYGESYNDYYGYNRYRHKATKYPTLGPTISISDASMFHSVYRKSWSYLSGEIQIKYPASKLWIDTLPKWWNED